MEHKIRLVSEKVQLAVQLIDDYTNEIVREDTSVSLEGQLKGPILNQSGYFVFTKIEGYADTLVIKSKYYFEEVLTIDLNEYKENALLVCRLIPSALYPFPSKATLIRGKVDGEIPLRIKACNSDMALGRLIKPYTVGDQTLDAVKLQGHTYQNMLVNIKHSDDEHDEFFVLEDQLIKKGFFKIQNQLSQDYPKGSLLLYAKDIHIDDRNQFTIYFSQLGALTSTFKLCSDNRSIEIMVNEGESKNIGLISFG